MILGDSLQVVASLARRENLAGRVQMINLAPPYGISFRSKFQPDLGNVPPEDKAKDLTREPEMVKAYRDTWTLGIHYVHLIKLHGLGVIQLRIGKHVALHVLAGEHFQNGWLHSRQRGPGFDD